MIRGIRDRVRAAALRLAQRLPDGVVLDLSRMSLQRPLDYAPSEILLDVQSPEEYHLRLRSCSKEPETVEWLETSLRPNDVFYDVGANVGAYSLVAARAADARVYAFEPGSVNFAKLCRNIHLNGEQDRIVPLALALSDESGITGLQLNLSPGFTGRLQVATAIDDGNTEHMVATQQVPAWRLDDLVSALELPPPNLIKIDVDGGEGHVVSGAARTLANRDLREILLEMETDEETGSFGQIAPLLRDAGFELKGKFPHSVYANYLFARNS